MKTHLFSYHYQGAQFCFELPADSAEDAQKRLQALAFARYDGEVVATLPVTIGPFSRLVAKCRAAAARFIRLA